MTAEARRSPTRSEVHADCWSRRSLMRGQQHGDAMFMPWAMIRRPGTERQADLDLGLCVAGLNCSLCRLVADWAHRVGIANIWPGRTSSPSQRWLLVFALRWSRLHLGHAVWRD